MGEPNRKLPHGKSHNWIHLNVVFLGPNFMDDWKENFFKFQTHKKIHKENGGLNVCMYNTCTEVHHLLPQSLIHSMNTLCWLCQSLLRGPRTPCSPAASSNASLVLEETLISLDTNMKRMQLVRLKQVQWSVRSAVAKGGTAPWRRRSTWAHPMGREPGRAPKRRWLRVECWKCW